MSSMDRQSSLNWSLGYVVDSGTASVLLQHCFSVTLAPCWWFPCERRAVLIQHRGIYCVSYNKETNNAEWVYEILNKDTMKSNSKKVHMSFGRNEFEGSDYHQGHLAAAANHRWCQEAYHDTFLISNMVPQDKYLNKGDWKTIENYCRDKATNAGVCNVHVYTGPLYLKEKKKKMGDELEDMYECSDPRTMQQQGGKAVPTHFFKVIIVEKDNGTVEEPECYVMPKLEKEDTDIKTEAKIDNTEVVKNNYTQDILKFEQLFGLKFIERHPNGVMMDCIKTITLTGEGIQGESCSANLKVRISSTRNDSRAGSR